MFSQLSKLGNENQTIQYTREDLSTIVNRCLCGVISLNIDVTNQISHINIQTNYTTQTSVLL